MIRAAVATAALLLLSVAGVQAQGQPVTVALDVDSSGNAASSLGTRESCNTIGADETLNIDVTLDGIAEWNDVDGDSVPASPDSGGLAAFQFALSYDPDVVTVTALHNQLLIDANGGTVPIDLSDQLPDTDGTLAVAFADFGTSAPEHGAGVLSRITLTSTGSGQSDLRLSAIKVLDASDNNYPLESVQAAAVAVGQTCTPPPPGSDGQPGATTTATEGDGVTGVPGTGTAPPDGADATPSAEDMDEQSGETAEGGASGETGNGDGLGTATWIAIGLGAGAASVAAGLAGWIARRRLRSP